VRHQARPRITETSSKATNNRQEEAIRRHRKQLPCDRSRIFLGTITNAARSRRSEPNYEVRKDARTPNDSDANPTSERIDPAIRTAVPTQR
jgi:hypothetical protein